jgi:hypothetical protein
VFASAADWPGWCRSGKTELAAIEALAAYAPRYAEVAKRAQLLIPARDLRFEVVERLKGNATTDFGAPGVPARGEAKPPTAQQARRLKALVEACWESLDLARAKAPAELRKGPRGGGRDRDDMYRHVLAAEAEYTKKIGARLVAPADGSAAAVRAFHKAILEAYDNPDPEAKWPVAYAARRTAWHALDHAWEMEDRIT